MTSPKARELATEMVRLAGGSGLTIGEYEAALLMVVGSHLCCTAPDFKYAEMFAAQLLNDVQARWNHSKALRAEWATIATAKDAAASGPAPR